MNVLRYRTEIVVAADRYVALQLPGSFPEGRAIVTVHIREGAESESIDPNDREDADHEDMEWWEEFEGEGDGGPAAV
jgi:hypothetical protein